MLMFSITVLNNNINVFFWYPFNFSMCVKLLMVVCSCTCAHSCCCYSFLVSQIEAYLNNDFSYILVVSYIKFLLLCIYHLSHLLFEFYFFISRPSGVLLRVVNMLLIMLVIMKIMTFLASAHTTFAGK